MNCIDGIEGVLRGILAEFQQRYAAGELDDTEFTANLRTVIERAHLFLEQNEEIGTSPDLLREILYKGCKKWWLKFCAEKRKKDAIEDRQPDPGGEEYFDHYFDYIYSQGTYPG